MYLMSTCNPLYSCMKRTIMCTQCLDYDVTWTIPLPEHVHVTSISPECIQAHGQKVCSLNLTQVTLHDLQHVKNSFSFRCFGHSRITGFATWFTVGFPESGTLTTPPYSEDTHWAQTLFYVDEPFDVEQDTVITGSFSIRPHTSAPRFLDVNLDYQVGGGPVRHKYYYMNDCIS